MKDSLDERELQQFSAHSDKWWDESGPFAPLHLMNPTRLQYIKHHICMETGKAPDSSRPLKYLRILDAGCGGGLVCEPLTRLGADVTGLDADQQAIDVAIAHSRAQGQDIDYICSSTEALPGKYHESYDVICALEIIEHVTSPADFIESLFTLLRPGGVIFISTLNRTLKSWALGIIAAEYVLRWLPKGTHEWKKFQKPSEVSQMVRQSGGDVVNINGIVLDPFSRNFTLSKSDLGNNYIMTARKSV